MSEPRIALRVSATVVRDFFLDKGDLVEVGFLGAKRGYLYEGGTLAWTYFGDQMSRRLRAPQPDDSPQLLTSMRALLAQVDSVLLNGSATKRKTIYHLVVDPQPDGVARPMFLHGKDGDWEVKNTSQDAKSFSTSGRAGAAAARLVAELRSTGLLTPAESLVVYEPNANLRRAHGFAPGSRIKVKK